MKKSILFTSFFIGIIFYFAFFFQPQSFALVGGKTCQQGVTEKGYDIGCTVANCSSSAKPCCNGCGGDSGCKPCDYCGPVEKGGFATCCLVKCCQGPFSDETVDYEWCSGTCPSDPSKGCNFDPVTNTCGCSSKCTLDTITGKCKGGCKLSFYSCGFVEGECECRSNCSDFKPDLMVGDSCLNAVCPGKDSTCIPDGAGGCVCVKPSPCALVVEYDAYCIGDCPKLDEDCIIDLSTKPPTCGCLDMCDEDKSSGKCTGGCSAAFQTCAYYYNTCTCGEKCTDLKPTGSSTCEFGVCPIYKSKCVSNNVGGCTCATPTATGTPSPQPTLTPIGPGNDTTTLQVAPDQKCGKTKPPTCGGECDDLDKVCTTKFSKKKNKMICKCRKQDAVDDDSDEEESEE